MVLAAKNTGEFYLSKLRTKDDLQEILISQWNYEYPEITAITYSFKSETQEKIIEAEVVAEHSNFQFLYFKLNESKAAQNQSTDQFLRSNQREIISQIPKEQRTAKIYIFANSNGLYWHFVFVDESSMSLRLKRFIIDSENRDKLRTPCEQLDNLKIQASHQINLQEIIKKAEQAFSVEVITDKFYKEFREVFDDIKNDIYRQLKRTDDSLKKAHKFTHLLVNRLLFLYFVQKKNCFGKNKQFLRDFWQCYRDNFEGQNLFYKNWLKILFVKALDNKFISQSYFTGLDGDYPDFNKILITVPYLNGGLFRYNDKLDSLDIVVKDTLLNKLFSFLEGYHFTIQESTPLDKDLSIDPEMIGNIYEMLVNVSQVDDERRQAGIFYTPKIEIELMIRRSLVEFLHKKTGIDKEDLYRFVFQEFEEQIIPEFSSSQRSVLKEELKNITIVDPACGSGHYLVVASQVLFELRKLLASQEVRVLDKFKEKKQIIEDCIYGVDVKDWAVEITKMRLWLDLFVDATEDELQSHAPLLPSLSFKIRVGDSLVQEIGGFYFKISQSQSLPSSLRGMLRQVKELKRRFYENDPFAQENNVRGLELDFYRAIIDDKIKENRREISQLNTSLQYTQTSFEPGNAEQTKLQLKNEKKIVQIEREIKALVEQKEKISLSRKFAFWPIEFADIFSEKQGFDIVIANPPYVRQEKIGDPTIEGEQDIEKRREYKAKLLKQLQYDWGDKHLKIDKKSDLYVYFYLKGLKLLNPNGVMCYISSNSWLDVGYGKTMQEILLKKAPIIAVYDNQAKRSFKHADVNTVIVILGAPQKNDWGNGLKDNRINFVTFKKSHQDILFSDIFIDIEKAQKRESNDFYRIHPVKQFDLYLDGLEAEKEEKGKQKIGGKEHFGIYTGNKWGGKYLRAPDIYWKILEKAGDKLVRLGDIAEVRFGIKTGCNEFFYLPSKHFDIEYDAKAKLYHLIPKHDGLPHDLAIEEEFLKPVVISPREVNTIAIKPEALKYKIFMCNKSESEMKSSRAFNYIKWGENLSYNKRPTCASREYWWNLGYREPALVNCNYLVDDRMRFYCSKNGLFVSDNFQEIHKANEYIAAIASIPLTTLFSEMLGRMPFGGGLLKIQTFEVEKILILNPVLLNNHKINELLRLFSNIKSKSILNIFREFGLPKPISDFSNIEVDDVSLDKVMTDRREIDKIVFEALGLTEDEQLEVYKAVVNLVKNRLAKARSLG